MFSPLVRLLHWCVSRSCCIVYFPLSCARLPLSLVAHVAAYCVPLSVSLYLLVTMALSMCTCSVRLCGGLRSLCCSSKLQLYVSSLYDCYIALLTFYRSSGANPTLDIGTVNEEYTGCNRRNGPDFGRVFLMLNYTEKPQNTYIQSSMVTEI